MTSFMEFMIIAFEHGLINDQHMQYLALGFPHMLLCSYVAAPALFLCGSHGGGSALLVLHGEHKSRAI